MLISVFKNAKSPNNFYNLEVEEILDFIENGKYSNEIEFIRTITQDLLKNPTKELKKKKQEFKSSKLVSPVFQGTFEKRSKSNLVKASGLAVIDLDHVNDPSMNRDFYFDNYNFIYAAFISPSGDGVKLICRIEEVKNDIEYKQYYSNLLKVFDAAARDESTKDISRICFVSYDPELRRRRFDKTSIFTDNTIKKNNDINLENSSQNQIIDTAVKMIKNSIDGEKHYTLLKAARLLGGYIASNQINEYYAIDSLVKAIEQRSPGNAKHDKSTILSGIENGKLNPINEIYQNYTETKETENNYIIEDKPNKKNQKDFPNDIFPDLINKYLIELSEFEKYDVKVTGSVFFWMMSLIIGNRIELEVFDSWSKCPVLWMAFIAQRGDKKSPTIDAMLNPLERFENEKYINWEREMKEWNKIPDNTDPEPIRPQRLIDGGTIEGYMKVHKNNMGGLGLVKDELTSLIKEMETDPIKESFWLKSFNNSSYSKDTKTAGNIRISRTFINIIGGIQPQKMKDFALKYTDSGLFDRFLFIPFEDNESQNFTLKKKTTDLKNYYDSFVEMAILSADNLKYDEDNRHKYKIDGDSIPVFEEKYNELLKKKHNYKGKNNNMYAYMSKIITNFPRFVTVFEFIKNLNVDAEFTFFISIDSINRAFKLLQFYINNAEDLLSDINVNDEMNNIVKSLKNSTKTEKVKALLKAVKDEEIKVSKTEIANFVGVPNSRISAIIKKM